MTRPEPGVELLERALAYTRGALLHVRPAHLTRPTPCAGWDLDRLLDHMHDALAAFTEGARGAIAPDPPARALDVRIGALQTTACGLLGAWSAPGTPAVVLVGGAPVPTEVVVGAAAVEIATHGWDVARSTGRAAPLPDDLARELLRVATRLVDDADRGPRFAPALVVPADAAPSQRLLGFLGRPSGVTHLTGPAPGDYRVRRTPQRPAS